MAVVLLLIPPPLSLSRMFVAAPAVTWDSMMDEGPLHKYCAPMEGEGGSEWALLILLTRPSLLHWSSLELSHFDFRRCKTTSSIQICTAAAVAASLKRRRASLFKFLFLFFFLKGIFYYFFPVLSTSSSNNRTWKRSKLPQEKKCATLNLTENVCFFFPFPRSE